MKEVLHKYPAQHPLLQRHIKFFWEIDADFMQLDHKIIPVSRPQFTIYPRINHLSQAISHP